MGIKAVHVEDNTDPGMGGGPRKLSEGRFGCAVDAVLEDFRDWGRLQIKAQEVMFAARRQAKYGSSPLQTLFAAVAEEHELSKVNLDPATMDAIYEDLWGLYE